MGRDYPPSGLADSSPARAELSPSSPAAEASPANPLEAVALAAAAEAALATSVSAEEAAAGPAEEAAAMIEAESKPELSREMDWAAQVREGGQLFRTGGDEEPATCRRRRWRAKRAQAWRSSWRRERGKGEGLKLLGSSQVFKKEGEGKGRGYFVQLQPGRAGAGGVGANAVARRLVRRPNARTRPGR